MTDYTAGFTHYDVARDPDDHLLDKVLPENPGKAHATTAPRPALPDFLESRSYQMSLCGRLVKVLLPLTFDPFDPDACPRCVAASVRGDMPPPDPRDDDEDGPR